MASNEGISIFDDPRLATAGVKILSGAAIKKVGNAARDEVKNDALYDNKNIQLVK